MHEMTQYYEALELGFGAPPDEVKVAYRDMVNVWHPDRFGSNERLKERAEEKMKVINNAYDKLKSYQPTEAEIAKYKQSQEININEAPIDLQPEPTATTETPKKQSIGKRLVKWFLVAIGIIWWIGILGQSTPAGLIIGAIAVGVYFWKKKTSGTSSTSTVKEKASAKTIDKSAARKLIIENLIILSFCDNDAGTGETVFINEVIKRYWPNEDSTNLLSEAHNNVLKFNNIRAQLEQNSIALSKLLDKKEKLEALALAEMLIKIDGTVTDAEKALYAIFKKLLKPTGIGASILNAFSDKCPLCNSKRVELTRAVETDRWKGTKNVTERLASGKTKTRTVQTTFVNIRRLYMCDECCHEWVTDTKEEK